MYRSKKLLTLPVISLSDGEELGKVQGVVIDPEAVTIAALILDYRKGFFKEPRIIPFEQITSFGDYAVTIKDSGSCERASQLPRLSPLFRRPTQILGIKVLTEDGNLLGTVEEFSFDPHSGKIIGLELTNSLLNTLVHGKTILEGDFITTIGKSAILVKAGTQNSLIREVSTLSGTAQSVKKTSQKVWSQTKETTKKFGESIYKSVEKFTAEEEDPSLPVNPVTQAPKDRPGAETLGSDSNQKAYSPIDLHGSG